MSRPTQGTAMLHFDFVYEAVTLYGRSFQNVLLSKLLAMSQPYNPNHALTSLVWAIPRSLATTRGIIIIFFSYGY